MPIHLTVAAWDDRIFFVALDGGEPLETLKAMLEAESGVPAAQQRLMLNGQPLAAPPPGAAAAAAATLASAGLSDGDMLMLLPPEGAQQAPAAGAAPAAAGDPDADLREAVALDPATGRAVRPAAFIRTARRAPGMLAQLERTYPPLAEAVRAEDPAALQAALARLRALQEETAAARRDEDALFDADPFDSEAQAKIEALIRRKNVEESYEQAMEHAPEMFAPVTMLYCHMEVRRIARSFFRFVCSPFSGLVGAPPDDGEKKKTTPALPRLCRSHKSSPTPPIRANQTNAQMKQVNGVPVKAFVDSGAQMTIMTEDFAKRCHLERLLDKRFHGTAVGVGSSRILGRVHAAPMKVAGHFITSSITVLEQKSGPQFIFGLDMLKRHRCSLNFAPDARPPPAAAAGGDGAGGSGGGAGGGDGHGGGADGGVVSGPHLYFGSCGVALPFLGDSEIPRDFAHDALEERSEEAAARSMSQALGAPKEGEEGGEKEGAAAGAAAGGAAGPSSSNDAGAAAARPAAASGAGAAAAGGAAAGAGGAPAASGGAGAGADDDKAGRLEALGFPRSVCEEALRAANGNEDAAAALLFGGLDG